MIHHMLCIPFGLIFGAGLAPSFFCNTSKCRALAATTYSPFVPELTPNLASTTSLTDMRALAGTASDLFKSAKTLVPLTASVRLPYPPSPLEQKLMRTHLVPYPLHPPLPVVFDHGSHHTFIDDNMMAAERDAILAVINASEMSA
jgi:hypothetical protein